MDTPKRYSSLLVTLHWLIALLVFTNLYLGLFVIEPALRGGGFRIPESTIAIHMVVGISILVLIIVRFLVRVGSKKPAPAGSGFLDVIARIVHYALYLFVLATVLIGLIFALQTNRLQRTFFGGGSQFSGPRNGNFNGFPTPGPGTPRPSFPGGNGGPGFGNVPGENPGFPGPRPGGFGRGPSMFFLLPLHLFIAITLLVLIVLHILAALYHQFLRRDNLIARMWYGRS